MSIIDVAISRLSICNCSEYELRLYLEKEFSALSDLNGRIDVVINRLKDLRVLNDSRLATHLAHHYAHKGDRFIKQLLQQKGIKEDVIDDVLLSLEDEQIRAFNEARKKIGRAWRNSEKDINDLERFLGGRRFSYNTITSVVNQLGYLQRHSYYTHRT